ncbi:hypothetical protein TRFO_43091 [Tritrichomonas foetus]|uniref:Uncharacterized protein n=1 Tax=Tritrichomonas foetus TaxID=1144522 RepID=A0A1J4KSV3_9EUKA|nr:hypothetical protein TRFO_43091 [Tritrichomonas foetus]|eukprot:OHT14339.1 hypothetical protein TRFO_43091 [Tritrichomonas foetus]
MNFKIPPPSTKNSLTKQQLSPESSNRELCVPIRQNDNIEMQVEKPNAVSKKPGLRKKKFHRHPNPAKIIQLNESSKSLDLNPDIISAIYLFFSGFTHSVAISSRKLNLSHVLQIAKELDIIDDNYINRIRSEANSSIYNFTHDGTNYNILDLNQYMENQLLNIEKTSSINLPSLDKLLLFYKNNYEKDFILAVKLLQAHMNINIFDIKNNTKSEANRILSDLLSDLSKLIEDMNSREISINRINFSQNVFSIILLIGLRELIEQIPIFINEYNDLLSFLKFMTNFNELMIKHLVNTLTKSLLFNSIYMYFPKKLNKEIFEFLSLLSNCTHKFYKIIISIKVQNKEKRVFLSTFEPCLVEAGSLNTQKLLVFGQNINLLHKFNFNPNKFFLVHDKEKNLLSKISECCEYKQPHPIFEKLFSILLNPDNNYFNFCHVWDSGIIKRNNVMMLSTDSIQISDNEPSGIVVLKFYPIFYNLLRKYCSIPTNIPFALLGSPGTGKSTMIAYIILRWYQMNDLFTEFNDLIQTIIIKPSYLSKKRKHCFFVHRKINGSLLFGIMDFGFGYVYDHNHIPASLVIHHHPNGDNTFVFNQILAIRPFSTLYIIDEYINRFRVQGSKSFILNSIGSKYSNIKALDNVIYSFLPSTNELRMIASLIKNSKVQELFHEKRCLIGPSIHYCLRSTLLNIRLFIKGVISTIKPDVFNSILMSSFYHLKKEINYIRDLIIYVSSHIPKGSDIYTYFYCPYEKWDTFSVYDTKIGSSTLTQYLKDNYFKIKENKKQIFFNIMSEESHLQKLKAAFFHLDLNSLKESHPLTFQTRQLTYSTKKSNIQSEESKTITHFTFNADSSEVEIVHNPELLFTSTNQVVYYLPPTVSEPGIDAAYKGIIDKKMTLVLLQFTVSNHHSFHMGVFEYYKNKIAGYKPKIKLEFWVVTPHLNQNFAFNKLKGYCSDPNDIQKKTIGIYEPLEMDKSELTSIFCQYTKDFAFRHVSKIKHVTE